MEFKLIERNKDLLKYTSFGGRNISRDKCKLFSVGTESSLRWFCLNGSPERDFTTSI
ncbi:MAG: hypothetical protein ACTS4T_00585 [Candidatus Hodgkinia cicadicola]